MTDQYSLPGSRAVFWLLTVYCLLPIILHWTAMLLERIGHQPVASVLDRHRYASLIYVFTATLMLLILAGMASSAWRGARDIWMRFVHR